MIEQWKFEGLTYRRANPQEIAALQSLPGAPHVQFACECGHCMWHAKNIALNSNGRYNGSRNVFYMGSGPECRCSGSNLIAVIPE